MNAPSLLARLLGSAVQLERAGGSLDEVGLRARLGRVALDGARVVLGAVHAVKANTTGTAQDCSKS